MMDIANTLGNTPMQTPLLNRIHNGNFQSRLPIGLWICAVLLLMLAFSPWAVAQTGGIPSLPSAIKTSTSGASATLLPNGQWLLLGGHTQTGPTAAAKIYDPVQKKLRTLNISLAQARAYHTATLLADGKVLVIGGEDKNGVAIAKAERFDPDNTTLQTLGDLGLLARTRHSATLLADGRLLLTGGVDAQGVTLYEAELFNPFTRTLERFNAKLDTARLNHLAALLPSHSVLVWGGVGANGLPTPGAELYDPQTQQFAAYDAAAASHALAQLDSLEPPTLVDSDPAHEEAGIAADKILSLRFSKPLAVASLNTETVALIGPDGQTPVAVTPTEGGLVAFIRPKQDLLPGADYTLIVQGATDWHKQALELVSIGFKTQALGLQGSAKAAAASANAAPVLSNAAANVSAQRSNPANPASSSSQLTATAPPTQTETAAAAAQDGEAWIPGPENRRGHWKSDRQFAHSRDTLRQQREFQGQLDGMSERARKITLEHMDASGELKARIAYSALPGVNADSAKISIGKGQNAVTGQVLRLNGQPLANASLSLSGVNTHTDANGEFVLAGVAASEQILVIDGSSADGQGKHYGRFEYRLKVEPGINALDFTLWMPVLDSQHAVKIPSPTPREVVVTNPDLPGLELHIPAGTVIRDAAGKAVTEVSITPIPADQLPFPMPYADVPIFYTIQPGGAILQSTTGQSTGATLVYPNYTTQPAGARFPLFDYDPRGRGWYTYTLGTVSADGKTIVADKDFTIYQFTTSSAASPGDTPPDTAPHPDGGCALDPVSCADGLFLEGATDLNLTDVMPLALTRTYRQNDATQRAFGIGANHSFDLYLWFVNLNGYEADAIEMILPNGSRVHFDPTGTSKGYTLPSTIFESNLPGEFYKAQFHNNGYGQDFWVALKDGRKFGFSYYQSRLKWLEDRHGNRVTIFRDSSNRAVHLVSPQGRYIDLAYGSGACPSCITQATDMTGRKVQYGYDSSGRLVKVTDPASGVTQYTYDTSHRMTSVKDPRGITKVTNVFFASGLVKTQLYPDGTSGALNYFFDSDQKIVQTDVTHERGDKRRITYNENVYPLTDTYALGKPEQQATTYERNAGNLVINKTDALGRVTHYDYDAQGNTTKVTRLYGTANATSWSYTYEPVYNQLTSVTDPLGHTTTLSYDNQGNVAQIQDALGNKATFTYDALGRPLAATRYNGATALTTTFTYDGPDLIQIKDPLGRITILTPDPAGRVLSVRDPLGRLARFEYDALDRVKTVVDPQGNATRYAYDGNGNLLSFTDAQNHITQFAYDSRNRVKSKTDALLKAESYLYDAGGNLLFTTDRKSQVSGFQYDFLNRLVKAGYGATSTTAPVYANTTTYGYDLANRLTSVVDTIAGSISRTYDDRFDALKTETTPEGSVGYDYYANGLRKSLTPSGGTAIVYGYDNADRLTQVSQAAGTGGGPIPATAQTVKLGYDSVGRQTSLTLPNGIKVAYAYDNADQLTGISYAKADGTALGGLAYTYDAAGQRTALGGTLAQSGLPQAINQNQYDANNRLISRDGVAYTYDQNGNLTSDGVRSYVWNARNQLVSLTGGGDSAAYLYDGLGRRRQATINSVATATLYDGWNPVQLKNGAAVLENRLTGLGLDANYARVRGGVVESYLSDALGSTLQLRDAGQNLTAGYTYDPYGGTVGTPPSTNVVKYTGREQDLGDLYYYRNRYYKPSVGRFVSEDPIGLQGGANLYGYVNGNPVSYLDPDGRLIWIVAGGVVGGVINLGSTYILNGGQISFRQGVAAFTGGAIAGALGAAAGPLGGTLALEFGLTSSGLGAVAATGALSAGASALGQEASNLIDPCHSSSVSNAAFWGGLGGGLAKFLPTKNLNSWSQARYFGPTTANGLFASSNSAWFWGGTFGSSGIGLGSNLNWPF